MEVKFSNEYSVITTTYSNETYEHTSDEIFEEFVSWVDEARYHDEDCLREAFEEYIKDYYDIVPNFSSFSNKEIEDDSIEFKLLNWADIYPKLTHLIEAPKEQTCCDKAPYRANYCPTCGKKLK